jgi:hypothetical protein
MYPEGQTVKAPFSSISDCQKRNSAMYRRGRQPAARVPNVASGTIFSGTLSELKYNNCDIIKN